MGRVGLSTVPACVCDSDSFHVDREVVDLPTNYESFLLSLCSVSSHTGLHHALRAGYGYRHIENDYQRYNSIAGDCVPDTDYASSRSFPSGNNHKRIETEGEGTGRTSFGRIEGRPAEQDRGETAKLD